jgi:hypothetical protein
MSQERYRISTSTSATFLEEGKEKPITVPAGSLALITDLDVP